MSDSKLLRIGIPLSAAVMLVGVGLVLFTRTRITCTGGAVDESNVVLVAVAALPLEFGTRIDCPESMIVAKRYPKDLAPLQFISNPDDASNQVLGRSLEPGVPITTKDLISEPPGKRLVVVKAADVVGSILPDSRLDILTTAAKPDAADSPVFEVIFRNVLVLAVHKPTAAEWSLLFALTPEEAEELAQCQERGAVRVQPSLLEK